MVTSKFRESFNKHAIDGNRAKSADPNSVIAKKNEYSGLKGSNSRNHKIDDVLDGKDGSGDDMPNEEDTIGMTQVKDSDELMSNEAINVPIVYDLHSNYLVLRKNNESQLIDSTLGKMIQGA